MINPSVTPAIVLKIVIGAVRTIDANLLTTNVFNRSIGAKANLRPNVSGNPKVIAGIPRVIAGINANAGRITGCANARAIGAVAKTAPVAIGARAKPPNNRGRPITGNRPPNSNGAIPNPPAAGAAVAAAVVAALP